MELLIVLFAIAAMAWILPLVKHGRLIFVAMAVLVIGTVFGPPFFAFDGFIQFSFDRFVWFSTFALAVIAWRLGHVRIPKLTRMDWVVIGIVGWFFVSALRGGPVPTGSSPVARWFFYIMMPAWMYVLARIVDLRSLDIRWLLRGLIVLGVYLAATAALEIAGAHSFVFPSFITDPEIWEFYGRGRGPLMNPAGNGIVMSLSLAAAIVGWMHAGRLGKLTYALLALVLLAGIYATMTRSAWLGAAAVVAVIALIHLPRWVRVLGLASVVIVGGMSVTGFKDELIRMKRDKNLSAADAEDSIKLRPLLAVVAWEMFKDRPIIGHGYGHYFEHNDRFHNNRSYDLPLEHARTYAQHNVLLAILVDTGMVGLGMFAGLLTMLAGIGWQQARKNQGPAEGRWVGLLLLAALAAYLGNGMFHDVMIIPMVHMFLFFIAGLGVTVHQCGLDQRAVEPARNRQRIVGRAATV